MKTVRDLLDRHVRQGLTGRDRELAALLGCVERGGPVVTFVHGIPGIGKSALLETFAPHARATGADVFEVDGRSVEPSERGFLGHMGRVFDAEDRSLDGIARRLSQQRRMVVVVVDTYERLRLLDSWLRRTFVPSLPENVRLVIGSRDPPSSRWFTDAGWQMLLRPLRLGPLSDSASNELLGGLGIGEEQARRIQNFARGHPLALRLAAVAALEGPEPAFGAEGLSRVVHELSRRVLEGVEDAATREALVAACAVRRTTVSLLSAMLPDESAPSLHQRLASLPFVYSGRDGLVVHDAVRDAVAAVTRADDPERYRRYRRAAWNRLRSEVREAGRSELWRYTADMLYLIENPIIREAFFPSGAQQLGVEPAGEDELEAIRDMVCLHDGREAADLIRYWWRVRPHRFRVVLDAAGDVVGFYFMLRADESRAAPQDPVTAAWLAHLDREGPEPMHTLFIRRWLSRDDGESPSPVQAACWLDIKRTYMEMRPDLRRVYLTVRDVEPYAQAAGELCFRLAPELETVLDGETYHAAWLDFGPASVDGWLRGLAATELGVRAREPGLVDGRAREMVLEDRRVPLSPRELDVLFLLEGRIGEAVPRHELLEAVWGDQDATSNVLDSVVWSLRRKMGDEAGRLETIRGFGYRLQRV